MLNFQLKNKITISLPTISLSQRDKYISLHLSLHWKTNAIFQLEQSQCFAHMAKGKMDWDKLAVSTTVVDENFNLTNQMLMILL